MKIRSIEDERDIANAAARVLHDRFVEAACNEKILYVQNDAVWSKTPHDDPVLIKQLSGRNPYLTKKFASRRTYKIKKRNISDTNK